MKKTKNKKKRLKTIDVQQKLEFVLADESASIRGSLCNL